MDYKIVVTEDAEADLDAFIGYLLFEKKNKQAAAAVLDDFEATKESLKSVAGSLKFCDNPKLNSLGYRRIHFLSHRYFMLYLYRGKSQGLFFDRNRYLAEMEKTGPETIQTYWKRFRQSGTEEDSSGPFYAIPDL